jgi:hypothetical protein
MKNRQLALELRVISAWQRMHLGLVKPRRDIGNNDDEDSGRCQVLTGASFLAICIVKVKATYAVVTDSGVTLIPFFSDKNESWTVGLP